MKLLFLVTSYMLMAMATDILYIIPKNSRSTVTNCPSQPCTTLSEYLSNKSLIPFASNFNIYLLSGSHHLTTDLEFSNVSNVSLIGVTSHYSSLVMFHCLSNSHIAFYSSYNITISYKCGI